MLHKVQIIIGIFCLFSSTYALRCHQCSQLLRNGNPGAVNTCNAQPDKDCDHILAHTSNRFDIRNIPNVSQLYTSVCVTQTLTAADPDGSELVRVTKNCRAVEKSSSNVCTTPTSDERAELLQEAARDPLTSTINWEFKESCRCNDKDGCNSAGGMKPSFMAILGVGIVAKFFC